MPHDRFRLEVPSALSADDRARRVLLWACLATVVLAFIPFAGLITYPLRLFVTFLHEAGHALAALATGGRVHRIFVEPDTSGLAITAGGIRVFISSAGYVGTTVAAAALLLALRWLPSRLVLGGLGASLGLITLIWVRNPFGFVTGAAMAALLVVGAWSLRARAAQFAVAFLAVQSGMNALLDLRTILHLTTHGHGHNDAANLAQDTGLPAVVWALLWAAVSVAILWTAIRSYGGGAAGGSRNLK